MSTMSGRDQSVADSQSTTTAAYSNTTQHTDRSTTAASISAHHHHHHQYQQQQQQQQQSAVSRKLLLPPGANDKKQSKINWVRTLIASDDFCRDILLYGTVCRAYATSMTSVCLSVYLSVTLVDCDHIVQQKVS